MTETIAEAATAGDYESFAQLVREYTDWCRIRYGEDKWFVDAAFNHQSLDAELAVLAISYGPPKGKTLLAKSDGEVCGGVAYRKLSDSICEMKRLFVLDRFKGKGIGRRLCEAIIGEARTDGFQIMRLDTGNLLTEAIKMYEAFGFRPCEAYNEYPEELLPYIVFMEKRLTDA